MTSRPRKRSVNITGHATSVTLEQEFWDCLTDIAQENKQSLSTLIAEIDHNRSTDQNLSSALRVYVLNWLKTK